MTCIIGLKHKGDIYIGADSAGVGGSSISNRVDSKIYEVGEFIFGFTSSFRMGQLLGYSFKPPIHSKGISIEEFMCTSFINEVKATLKEGGFSRNKNGEDEGGTFIVGYRGRLFTIFDDYQISEVADTYDAVGCGEDLAKGAMYSTKTLLPLKRIRNALEAAAYFSSGVRAPFKIIKQKRIK